MNRTNNNNTHDRISNRDDAQTTPLLSLNTPSSQSGKNIIFILYFTGFQEYIRILYGFFSLENQFDMTDGMKCKQRIAKSYDDIGNICYGSVYFFHEIYIYIPFLYYIMTSDMWSVFWCCFS